MNKIFKFVIVCGIVGSSACNKELPNATPIPAPTLVGPSILTKINSDASFSILQAAIIKANTFSGINTKIGNLLADSTQVFTFFAPDNNAFAASLPALGLPPTVAALQFLSAGKLDTILRYHLIGGVKLSSSKFTTNFPNLYMQSSFLLQAPSATSPPAYRMPIFASVTGPASFVNNIPLVQKDIEAEQSVIHKPALVLLPPSRMLWERINTDTAFSYFKAAVLRADSGVVAPNRLVDALSNPAASLTVFAPTNAAFVGLLTQQIAQVLISQGVPASVALANAAALASSSSVFTNPLVMPVLTPTTVKGIVVYHMLGKRTFLANMANGKIGYPTLLNSAIPTHSGVNLAGVINASGSAVEASVKGKMNASASQVLLNPSLEPTGSSDQLYVNGIIHRVNQVLIPQ